MLSGAADYTWTGFTWPVYQRELAQGIHIVTPPNWAQFDIFFNNRKYPLNIVQVRQAIAYIVHRKSLQVLADGGHTWYSYVQHPSGLYDANELDFVTKAQLGSLNTYPYDPAKAAQLLESVGFKKVNGKWMMPNGKPFTLTFGGPEGWTGPTAVVRIASGWLTQFGIPTTGSAVEQPGYWTYQQEGDFELDWGWGGFAVNPLARMAYDLGYNLNFSNAGTYKGDPGIGFGPIETVPGIGRVNVPATIDAEAGTASGALLDRLTWDWAKFINTELPVLPFYDKNIPFQYSTRTYTDWPPRSSPIWGVMGYSIPAGVALMAEEGYVRPAS
jgi:peptide/nickel transport system substrate-binding protein